MEKAARFLLCKKLSIFLGKKNATNFFMKEKMRRCGVCKPLRPKFLQIKKFAEIFGLQPKNRLVF